MTAVARLRAALIAVAERRIPGDPLPCFCVAYEPGQHNQSCKDTRDALAVAGTARSSSGNDVVSLVSRSRRRRAQYGDESDPR